MLALIIAVVALAAFLAGVLRFLSSQGGSQGGEAGQPEVRRPRVPSRRTASGAASRWSAPDLSVCLLRPSDRRLLPSQLPGVQALGMGIPARGLNRPAGGVRRRRRRAAAAAEDEEQEDEDEVRRCCCFSNQHCLQLRKARRSRRVARPSVKTATAAAIHQACLHALASVCRTSSRIDPSLLFGSPPRAM